MYKINLSRNNHGFKYVTLPIRISMISRDDNDKVVLYLTTDYISATFRYRYHNVVDSLQDTNYKLTYFLSNEVQYAYKYIESIDIIIVQRALWTREFENFILFAKTKGVIIVYDIDDYLFDHNIAANYVNYTGNAKTSIYDPLISQLLVVSAKINMLSKYADCIITTNDFLSKKAEEVLNVPSFTLCNFLGDKQIEEAMHILENREYSTPFVIGYFSGSPSHQNDFNVASSHILRLMEKYPDVHLKIVGHLDFSCSDDLKSRVHFLEPVDYLSLMHEVASVDLNIAPLVLSNFTDSKSELKYFEAAMVKVPSCVSSSYVFKSVIEDGVNGLICHSYEWFDKLEFAYLNRDKLEAIAENAFERIKEEYYPSSMKYSIIKLLEKISQLKEEDK